MAETAGLEQGRAAVLGGETHDPRFRAEQARALASASGSAAVINFANACLLALVFWQEIPWSILAAWLGFNLAYGLALLLDRKVPTAQVSSWFIKRVTLRAGALGLVWGGFVWVMTEAARPDQMLLVGIVMTGMMAGGATRLAAVPSAAAAFLWFIALLSAGAAVAHFGPAIGWAPALLVLGYALFLSRHVAAYSAVQFRNWADRAELAARNETVSLLLNNFNDNASDWIWQIDDRGRIVDSTERFRDAAGNSALDGLPFVSLFRPSDNCDALVNALSSGESFRDMPLTLTVSGQTRHWTISGRARGGGFQGIASDVTDKVEAEQRLAYLAHFDELTGLQSRVRFREEIARAVSAQRAGELVLLYCLDLDRFKAINDTMGHPFGDALLAVVGQRLRTRLALGDSVARLGGDEFAILHRAPRSAWSPADAGSDIIALFDKPFQVGDAVIALNTSVGVRVIEPMEKIGADESLRDADLALYRAKAMGRGTCSVFQTDMTAHATRRLALEQALRTASAKGELSLAFQPFAEIATGRMVGMEALLRWNSPEFGSVSPDEFVPIAEESGLILSIGAWAIGEAIREAAGWPAHLRIAVNLSALQVQTQSLAATVAQEMRRHGFDPDRLELEITESTLLDGTEAAVATIGSLKMLGVRIALDDFGTGFSSLSYLSQFPFDKIKIDKSFVDAIATSPANAAVVKAIIDLGVALGMETTAEGVEEEGQLTALRALGCHEVQGFLLAPPLPAREAHDLAHAATGERVMNVRQIA